MYHMRMVKSPYSYVDNEFYVLEVDEVGVIVDFGQQVDDITFNNPDTDVYMVWGPLDVTKPFPTDACLLIPGKPDVKELNSLKTNLVAIRAVSGKGRFFLNAQRN